MAQLICSFLVCLCLALVLSQAEAHRKKGGGKLKKHNLHGMKKFGDDKDSDSDQQYDLAEAPPLVKENSLEKKEWFISKKARKDKKMKKKLMKMKRKGKKHRKGMKKNLGWMKFKSESDCEPQCMRGELCILGPLDSKPFCVAKKNLRKSIKIFHRYHKKEMKEWKKFQKRHHYGKIGGMSHKADFDMETMKNKKFNKHHGRPYAPPVVDGECLTSDFKQIRSRMMGWFHVLHGQDHLLKKKDNLSLKRFHKHVSVKKELREHDGDRCECFKSAMWQFKELDLDHNDQLTVTELKSIEENTMEPCVQPYLTSCDRDADGNLTADEWCCCFSHVVAPCFKKLHQLKQSGADEMSYIPRCDREGYYMREQCKGEEKGEGGINCWCVDYNGNEVGGSFTDGRAHCSKLALEKLEKGSKP